MMELLTKKLRKKLPGACKKDGKGGEQIAHVKFFTPDADWTWYAIEGEPIFNDAGEEVDFFFFGLVDGFKKEFGTFALSELLDVRGALGLPIERDLYWTPKPLNQIAPELFRD